MNKLKQKRKSCDCRRQGSLLLARWEALKSWTNPLFESLSLSLSLSLSCVMGASLEFDYA